MVYTVYGICCIRYYLTVDVVKSLHLSKQSSHEHLYLHLWRVSDLGQGRAKCVTKWIPALAKSLSRTKLS